MRGYEMKITVLIENSANGELEGEHGLSVLIEYRNKLYLLDTGASDAFLDNADKLGTDLSRVDTAVLSHAHYDHSGGYRGFFSRNRHAKVYLRTAAKEKCYAKIGPLKKYIGIPKGVLECFENRFVYVSENCMIDDGVWLIGHSTEGTQALGSKAHMYRQTRDGLHADDFQHEHSLVFEGENGLVILGSCCHVGADNIIMEVKAAFPDKEIAAIIGGFHLMGLAGAESMGVTADDVRTLGNRLVKMGVKHIYTCHCTGNPAYKVLKDTLGDKVEYISTGDMVEL